MIMSYPMNAYKFVKNMQSPKSRNCICNLSMQIATMIKISWISKMRHTPTRKKQVHDAQDTLAQNETRRQNDHTRRGRIRFLSGLFRSDCLPSSTL